MSPHTIERFPLTPCGSLGFDPLPDVHADRHAIQICRRQMSCYRIWRKKMLDSESNADRAAFNESSRSHADRLSPE